MDVKQLRINKGIAEDALEQLSELGMRSWNKPWNLNAEERRLNLQIQRNVGNALGYWGDLEKQAQFIKATGQRLGNCWERATLYADFAARDPRTMKYELAIYRAKIVGWDHVIAILAKHKSLPMGVQMAIKNFEDTAVILDGWTEDWYFPNLNLQTAIRYGVWRLPSPFAAVVRVKTLKMGTISLQASAKEPAWHVNRLCG